MNNVKDQIIKEIDKITPSLEKLSLDIFNHPELCFNEFYAQQAIKEYLSKTGIPVKTGIGGLKTAFRGFLVKNNKPKIAFIAEYDALPDLGHACGHNIIAASSVGAICALNNFKDKFPGNVEIIGTPAEEGGGGKIILIRKKVFKDIDAAIMVHPSNKIKTVRRMLAFTEVNFTFFGKAAHASANPDKGVNALDAVIATFNSINALRQQIKDDARVHGIITNGGAAPNIIPDMAACKFYVRAFEFKYFLDLLERVKMCADGAAISSGTKLQTIVSDLVYKPFNPNYEMAEIFKSNLEFLGLKEDECSELDGMGSSDVGNLSNEIPTIHADMTICNSKTTCHTKGFAKAAASKTGTKAINLAAKAMALTAFDILSSPAILKKIKNNFKKY